MKKMIEKGTRFGKLTVLGYAYTKDNFRYYECRCDCGNTKVVRGSSLNRGATRSCGCLYWSAKGESKTRLYHMWSTRKFSVSRCGSLCREWINDYPAFKEWAIKNGYTDGKSILRKDVSRECSPENCFIGDPEEQIHIGPASVFIKYKGKKQYLSAWAREIGVSRATLWARINVCGMSPRDAIAAGRGKTQGALQQ